MKQLTVVLTTLSWAANTRAQQPKISVKPEVVMVEGGTFQMGSYVNDSEEPVHRVLLHTYSIGKYPVTVWQYQAFCDATGRLMPECATGWGWDSHAPMVNVTCADAVSYCEWLGETCGGNWRLPTEAEWEYAARGGNQSKGYRYSGSDDLGTVGWFAGDTSGCPSGVGRKKANELGIHDMSGNVWEWCADWYDADYYANSAASNPQGPSSGTNRVLRGGAWDDIPLACRVTYRGQGAPDGRYLDTGFRVVLS